MLSFLLKPHVNLGTLALRLGLATIFIFHGSIKLAQGGGTLWSEELPHTTQMVVAWAEFIAAIALAIGFLTRVAAVGIIVIMIGAISMVTGSGDFIRSSFTQKGFEFRRIGYEYNFAVIVMCLALIFLGSGLFSLDHFFWRRKKAAPPAS